MCDVERVMQGEILHKQTIKYNLSITHTHTHTRTYTHYTEGTSSLAVLAEVIDVS